MINSAEMIMLRANSSTVCFSLACETEQSDFSVNSSRCRKSGAKFQNQELILGPQQPKRHTERAKYSLSPAALGLVS
jgi:hypothetical protein